jgi:MFS family permease
LVVGKFILGFFYDRLGPRPAALISGLLMALSFGLIMFIELTPILILMLVVIGIGLPIGTVSITWLTNFFFGKENYSKYYGTVQFANSLGMAIGVPAIAAGLENLGNPNMIWIALTVLRLVMVALFMGSIRANLRMKASLINSKIEVGIGKPGVDEIQPALEKFA